jgi:hypothetical protein
MENARDIMHNAEDVMGKVMKCARYGLGLSCQKQESSWEMCAIFMENARKFMGNG